MRNVLGSQIFLTILLILFAVSCGQQPDQTLTTIVGGSTSGTSGDDGEDNTPTDPNTIVYIPASTQTCNVEIPLATHNKMRADKIKFHYKPLPNGAAEGWVGVYIPGAQDGDYKTWRRLTYPEGYGKSGKMTIDFAAILESLNLESSNLSLRFFCGKGMDRSPYTLYFKVEAPPES